MTIVFSIFMISLTVLVYLVMSRIYSQVSFPLFLPILTSTIIIIVILHFLHLSYANYMLGGRWINHLLGPAIVALAYPLYNEWSLIKKYRVPILSGVLFSTILALFGIWATAQAFGIKKTIILSLLPKSVTSPVAIDLSKEIGGFPALTVTFVMIAGVGGALLGPYLFRLLRINHQLSKGIGYGSAAHAIGTTKALEEHQITGAISSIAMILSAILTAILLPIFFSFIK
ncbi:hypothetical protein GCM10011391_04990 [Pullulanibacillus camelliae]|uniref:LrgB family protein n=1 Tax=Pullulanibacillus camelliae TaxID=1707096 RepID=A0A8J2VF90_9BACL|nr:LrgB family protein [Pullulanibacillus camelliae]GGE29437.1 hypothetical protein GCM10011391_04990 [Pullulanibacillus camelliae]